MVTAVAFEDAKVNQFRVEGDGTDVAGFVLTTPFMGSLARSDRGIRDVPQAFLSKADPGRTSRAHFHALDQFQILIGGGVKIGRHEMAPLSVHFAHAYTPYGPLFADADDGMTQLVLRPFHDPLGPLRIPDRKDVLQSVPDRQPWQVFTNTVTFPKLDAGKDFVLEPIAGMKNDQGLATYTLSMKPNTRTTAPDPSRGDGQYIVVAKGSVIHEGKEQKAIALVYVGRDESPYEIHSGAEGLEALVLNFPPSQSPSASSVSRHAVGKGWQCSMCAFIYDQALGLPTEAIKPGTDWRQVPETWSCPNCNSAKSFFKSV